MQRLIYCPNDDYLDEARLFSKKNGLPIVVGDNDLTLNIDFDRQKISVVSIPERKDITFKPVVKNGMHQVIIYNNEFTTSDIVDIKIDGVDIITVFKEKYRSKYAFICQQNGEYNGGVYVDSVLERNFNFVVN